MERVTDPLNANKQVELWDDDTVKTMDDYYLWSFSMEWVTDPLNANKQVE